MGAMLLCEQFDKNGSPKQTLNCGEAIRLD